MFALCSEEGSFRGNFEIEQFAPVTVRIVEYVRKCPQEA